VRNLVQTIKTGLGVIGILTALYWALLNAGYGLLGKLFGQGFLDWVNAEMNAFNEVLPYIVFFLAFAGGCVWLGYTIYTHVQRHKRKATGEMTRAEIVDEIKETLSSSLGKTIELLDKLK
jgi:hypothetical protein